MQSKKKYKKTGLLAMKVDQRQKVHGEAGRLEVEAQLKVEEDKIKRLKVLIEKHNTDQCEREERHEPI
jgi:hypothetical protein